MVKLLFLGRNLTASALLKIFAVVPSRTSQKMQNWKSAVMNDNQHNTSENSTTLYSNPKKKRGMTRELGSTETIKYMQACRKENPNPGSLTSCYLHV